MSTPQSSRPPGRKTRAARGWSGEAPADARQNQSAGAAHYDIDSSGELATILDRLDQRSHVMSARLDISRAEGQWVAQLIADPLYEPFVGRGSNVTLALLDLLDHKIDWRRVRR